MQSKKKSFIESVTNVIVGLFLSLLTWKIAIIPIFKIYPNNQQIIIISVIFTILSILRLYVIRRIFNE
jgi:cytochrome c biogenesis protein CcdA